jgi:glycine betaine/proline transport system substrate-binding protein
MTAYTPPTLPSVAPISPSQGRSLCQRIHSLAMGCGLALLASTTSASNTPALTNELPGKGVIVQPVKNPVQEENFQHLLVMELLQKLGYTVRPFQEVDYPTAYMSIAAGDATFIASHWNPLHADFYKNAGGDAKLYRQGTYIRNAAQGYLIDKKTADQYRITNIAQLQDPNIAQLFDADGDGKADLTGCTPGWGCEAVVEHHLDAYQLRATITHQQGNYAALIADTLARYKAGKPVLYYTWTPYWVSNELQPGKDVVWLEVPFSSLPGAQKGLDTTLPNGKNYGFTVNSQHIVANQAWAQAHPAAAKLFAVMQLPLADVNAQNHLMSQGQNQPADVQRHVQAWIRTHQQQVDDWLQQARQAALPTTP